MPMRSRFLQRKLVPDWHVLMLDEESIPPRLPVWGGKPLLVHLRKKMVGLTKLSAGHGSTPESTLCQATCHPTQTLLAIRGAETVQTTNLHGNLSDQLVIETDFAECGLQVCRLTMEVRSDLVDLRRKQLPILRARVSRLLKVWGLSGKKRQDHAFQRERQ